MRYTVGNPQDTDISKGKSRLTKDVCVESPATTRKAGISTLARRTMVLYRRQTPRTGFNLAPTRFSGCEKHIVV